MITHILSGKNLQIINQTFLAESNFSANIASVLCSLLKTNKYKGMFVKLLNYRENKVKIRAIECETCIVPVGFLYSISHGEFQDRIQSPDRSKFAKLCLLIMNIHVSRMDRRGHLSEQLDKMSFVVTVTANYLFLKR